MMSTIKYKSIMALTGQLSETLGALNPLIFFIRYSFLVIHFD
ncbi:hypothetical protein J2772_003050 [Chryseobacterium jejuense]|nr:hypothetical protein [Chryseobacterium jejuense]